MDGNSSKVILNTTFISMLSGCIPKIYHAVYLLRRQERFQNRTIIKNEYGLPIGKLSVDRWAAHPENIEL